MSGIPYIVSEDCLACGACVDVCPEVFQLNESLGYAQVVHPDSAAAKKIQEAVDICPVHCILWDEDGD